MNLIQQLQATPKWKEFEEWYGNYLVNIDSNMVGNDIYLGDIEDNSTKDIFSGYPNEVNFCFLPIEFQKGVFEKFIEETNDSITTTIRSNLGIHSITVENDNFKKLFYSFEELIIWYFNN